ncbi:hypothetical protein FH972_020390 [Carpinus fangiana]|uniref:At1g61320/AtMIF1 LRR domain-containing protein n=1 Tax=Carpinus fangiana TaxID=176857 RepID=A0A5N6RUM9_9ROSI|nr:hypothetical protein FH972_020390 [Carpinus fangiana]
MRWRHVWRATKNIDFNERFFVRVGEPDEMQETQRLFFIHFVRQWMENYQEPQVENFQLTFTKPGIFRVDMDRCIAFAITRNVKFLAVDFSDPTWGEDDLDDHAALFDLPLNVYGHAVLESLKLFSCSFRMSEFVNFEALKDVSLGWLELRMSAIEAILLNCPLLESLSLKKCWNIEHLDIRAPNLQLRNLVIDKCKFLQDCYEIEAPNLRFFKYSGAVGFFAVEISGKFMEVADLDFGLEFEFDEAAGHILHQLIEQLWPIRILTVSSYMLQVIPCGEEPLKMGFPLDLTHLTLKAALHEHEFFGICFFLRSSPRLETLTIQIGPGRVFADYEPPFPLPPDNFWEQFPTLKYFPFECFNTLTAVEVKGFRGTRHELPFLRYLIRSGNVLEHLHITVSKEGEENGGNVEAYHEKAQVLQTFQKASPNLQISIC